MAYVNGFLAPVHKDQLDAYKKTAQLFADFVMAHGAIQSVETVGEGLDWGKQTSFPRAVDLQDGEVVVFSWILYPSKEVANKASAAMMEDAGIAEAMKNMVFDGKRMIWAGFEPLIMAGAGAA